jgi:hypothetical protein
MGRTRKRREPKPPKTAVHALFVRRVRARGLNPLRLEEYGIKQRTLADVLRGADPRLSTIYAAARALGMNTADLLREGPDKRVNTVTNLHPPRAPMIPPAETSAADRKKHRR